MPEVNWLDVFIGVTLLVSILSGFSKGFSREIIGLAAALVGLLLASQFYRMAGKPLKPYISEDFLASVAGFLIIFFAVLIVGSIVSSIVRRILKTIGLSAVDRLLGGLYGLVRGSLVALAIIMGLVAFKMTDAVVKSRMAPYLVEAAGFAVKVAPAGLRFGFQREYEDLKSAWKLPEEKN